MALAAAVTVTAVMAAGKRKRCTVCLLTMEWTWTLWSREAEYTCDLKDDDGACRLLTGSECEEKLQCGRTADDDSDDDAEEEEEVRAAKADAATYLRSCRSSSSSRSRSARAKTLTQPSSPPLMTKRPSAVQTRHAAGL
jgi:hypothetical protein